MIEPIQGEGGVQVADQEFPLPASPTVYGTGYPPDFRRNPNRHGANWDVICL